jgi:ankyrin repeat protein
MTETSNVVENNNICIKIAEVLLEHGADVNAMKRGKTILMNFSSISLLLEKV